MISNPMVAHASQGSIASNDPSKVDWSIVESGNCLVIKDGWGFKACAKGDRSGPWNVAFIGDSHMRQYFTPLDVLAFRYRWKVTYISKSACPVTNHKLFPVKRYPDYSCRSWNRSLEHYLQGKPAFDLVINSNSAFDSHANIEMARGYKQTVLSQVKRGTAWLVISDNPKPQPNFQKCIADNPVKAEYVCRIPYSKAMKPVDVLPRAVHALKGVIVADFRKIYCRHMCPAVINGITVYRDYSHITQEWSKQMLGKIDALVPAKFKAAPAKSSKS